jgi:hypothetical protein
MPAAAGTASSTQANPMSPSLGPDASDTGLMSYSSSLVFMTFLPMARRCT